MNTKEVSMITKGYYQTRIFFLAIRWIPKVNLGDMVWYGGTKHTVCNGTRPNSWRLGDLDNGCDGWVLRKDCKKVLSWENIKHSFCSGKNFYMTSWFDIWCREGIKPWMRECNIWPKDKQ